MAKLYEVKVRIELLITEINYHSYRYYVLDSPEIDGAEYDDLIPDLK